PLDALTAIIAEAALVARVRLDRTKIALGRLGRGRIGVASVAVFHLRLRFLRHFENSFSLMLMVQPAPERRQRRVEAVRCSARSACSRTAPGQAPKASLRVASLARIPGAFCGSRE